MNITEETGRWRLAYGFVDAPNKPKWLVKDQPFPYIEDRATGQKRVLDRSPDVGRISSMPFSLFLRKCQQAFDTGVWPKTRWSSGDISD